MTEQGHHQVSSLVHDLVEMAEATRRLPELEQTVRHYEHRNREDGERIARLEQKLLEANAKESELHAKIREVQTERDDASFRSLEADDKALNALNALRTIQASVGQAIAAITGDGRDLIIPMDRQEWSDWEGWKRAQAEAKAKAEAEAIAAQEAARQAEIDRAYQQANPVVSVQPDPTTAPTSATGGGTESGSSSSDPFVASGTVDTSPHAVSGSAGTSIAAPSTEAQEVPQSHPTASEVSTQSQSVSPISASSEASVSSSDGPPKGKYFGKRYADWAYYVPLHSWLEGGGTEEDYNWRPAAAQ